MKRSLSLFFLLLVSTANAQVPDTVTLVNKLFSRWNNATPGGAVAISRGEKIIYNKAFGLADLEHSAPNTTETVFESGSVAKQFTAAAILLLASEGKLSLQDDIRRFVPEIPRYQAVISIQHLLNHTSGLKDWGSIAELNGWPRTTKVYSLDLALLIMARQGSTNFVPGLEYSYSNSNYSILTLIVERVSGQSLASFTAERFFKPLGMNHTQWRDNFREVISNRAIAYTRSGNGYEQLMPFENVHGHGGLLTTTTDLLKWNSLLETPGIGGKQVLDWRIQKGKLSSGQEITYASGLVVDRFNGQVEISHSGATAGYRAWLAYYPQKKLTITLLSNDGSFNPTVAGRDVARIFIGDVSGKTKPSPLTTLPESDLKRYDGIYRSIRHFDTQKLEYRDHKLLSNGHELQASHRDTLNLDNMKWIFRKQGQIWVKSGAGDTMTYIRVNPPNSNPAALLSLSGEYRSEEVDANYLVDIKDNKVWLQIKPNQPIELKPEFQDAFFAGGGLYEFKRDKKGKVTGLQVSISRAERMAFTKMEKRK